MSLRLGLVIGLTGLCCDGWAQGVPGAAPAGVAVRRRGRRVRPPKTWSPPIPEGRAAVTLSIRTAPKIPPAKVTWGRRLLGETPLTLKWPQDSGPVDVVVQAEGYLPVHSRLYTFADDKLSIKLANDEDKKSIFGYRREVSAVPPVAGPGAAVPPVAGPGAAVPPVAGPGAAVPPVAPPPVPPAAQAPPPAAPLTPLPRPPAQSP